MCSAELRIITFYSTYFCVMDFELELRRRLRWELMDVLIVQPQLPSIHLDASTIGRVCFGWDDLGVFGFIRLIRITDDSTLFIESILSGSCDAQYGELRFPYCPYAGLESILDVFIDFILTKVLNYGKKC